MATYFRMVTTHLTPINANLSPEVRIQPYDARLHHDLIPHIYARAFKEPPWPADWEDIPEFDPSGVFVVEPIKKAKPVGFIIGFMRGGFGYISVVAVMPEMQRQGIATALIQTAAAYLFSRQASYLQIDVEENNLPALKAYRKLGFELDHVFED